MQPNILGELLRERRLELKTTLREIHERTGVSTAYLTGIEKGRFKQPNAANLARIAVALDLDVNDVLYIAGYQPIPDPELTTYLRRRYNMTLAEAEQVHDYVTELRRPHHITNQGDLEDEPSTPEPTS